MACRADRPTHDASAQDGCRARRPAARSGSAQGRPRVHRELCDEALDTYDPTEAEHRRVAAADGRKVDVHIDQAGRHGTIDIVASTDTGDAIDFETVTHAAADLKQAGSTETLDVRRSMALGVIARHYLGHGLGPATKPRQVTINVHLRDQQIGRCDTTRAPISVEQVKGWCTHPDTHVTIRPVLDLNEHIRVDGYEVPDRLARQAAERDGTCIHPWCTQPARSCDNDHCDPYDQGGTTSTDNIAPGVEDTTAPRPTDDGATNSSDPAPTSGNDPAATGTTATASAPPTSADSLPTEHGGCVVVLRHGRARPMVPRVGILGAGRGRRVASTWWAVAGSCSPDS